MQIAQRVFSLAQKQNDPALMVGTYRALGVTLYFLGNDFETSRQYAMRGAQIWRAGGVRSVDEEVTAPAVTCLIFQALSQWHIGEVAPCHATMAEAISLAKELDDTHALAFALWHAGWLAYYERDPVEVERLVSDVIDLSTRHHYAQWLAVGSILRGWARSASGETSDGISWIEDGTRNYRATGVVLGMPYYLALKAEALHLADRTSEALEALNEAEALAERFEQSFWCAELHRLRGVFLTATDADDIQICTSFLEAIRIAKEQKSMSLATRAEASYAEYRRQKASGLGGRRFRLPLC